MTAIMPESPIGGILNNIPKLSKVDASPPNWIWPGLLVDQAFHIISAEPGSMKSYFMLQVACGLAQGQLFGVQCLPRNVVYVDKENPASMVLDRAQHMGLKDESRLTYWGMWCDMQPADVQFTSTYLAMAKELKPLFVFDSLVRFHSGDENDAGHMAQVSRHFRALTAVGATVVLLHHKGKPTFDGRGSPYRGSSEIAGSCDIGHGLTKVQEGGGQMLTFKCFKNRFEEEKEIKFFFDKHRKIFVPTETPVISHDEQIVLSAIKAEPGRGQRELALKTGFGEHKLRDILKRWDGRLWTGIVDGKRSFYFPLIGTAPSGLLESSTSAPAAVSE